MTTIYMPYHDFKAGEEIILHDFDTLWHHLSFWKRVLIWLHLRRKPKSVIFTILSVTTTEITLSDDAEGGMSEREMHPMDRQMLCLTLAYEREGIAGWLQEFASMWDGDCWETHRRYFGEAITKLRAAAADAERLREAEELFRAVEHGGDDGQWLSIAKAIRAWLSPETTREGDG